MAWLTALAGCVSLVVTWIVTARLFARARQTGGAPENALALAFAGLFVVGYPLAAASRAPGLAGTNEGSLLFTIGMLGMVVGLAGLNHFPQLVFRPGRPWALALQGLGTAVGLVAGAGCVVCVASADSVEEMVASVQPWSLALLTSIGLPFLWNAVESTLYYRRMRRRIALGLASRVTTHRFLLWALASWASVGEILALLGIRASGRPIVMPIPMAIIACTVLVASICWWLAFFMPAPYRAWIAGPGSDGAQRRRS